MSQIRQATKTLEAFRRLRSSLYRPYSKQAAFHALGAHKRERAFMCGNQLGKTWAAGNEVSYHMSGRYPEWWDGKRFPGPTNWWASNTNNETTRDNPQRILLGRGCDWGTGTIPKEILEKPTMARGFPNLVDTFRVKHCSGGWSGLQFKGYDQGRLKWQGETLNGGVWYDEEPDIEIYSEGITRLAPGAVAMMTLTPLLGMSDVACLFYPYPDNDDRALIQMEIEEVDHYTEAEKQQRVAGYPEWEREARSKGIPMLGSGRIFPISEESIEEPAIETIPAHWPELVGMDFGYDHPFAAVHGAWDRDADVVHITKAYRERQQTPPIHAAAIKPWGSHLRCAWPHDGHAHEKGSGIPLKDQYRALGLKMLPEHATFYSGGYSPEVGISEMLTRMQTGKLKVAEHLHDWFAEFRTYHRKDGKIVKERDDLIDATRTLLMSLRYARTRVARRQPAIVGMDYQPLAH